MTLNLVSPIGSNFIKDFPGVNAANLDAIDAAVGPALRTNPLTVINPVLGATTTNPTLGTGGYSIAYVYQIFNQLHVFGEFRFGTGFSAGSGTYTIALPFVVDTLLGAHPNLGKSPIVGTGSTRGIAANANKKPVTVHLRTASLLQFGIGIESGTGNRDLRDSGYITWVANDGLSWNMRVKKVP